MLTETAIKEFQQIYKDSCGIEISSAEAAKQATNLLNLFKTIYKPIKK
ncbi:MAG: hypothetical protein WC310_02315 [Patescibacteria group bacterium]|jgi:hypothetical protein